MSYLIGASHIHTKVFMVWILLPLFISACASNRPYPKNWEPIVQAAKSDCSDVEGLYHNFDDKRVPFTSLIFGYRKKFVRLAYQKNQGPYFRLKLVGQNNLRISNMTENKVLVEETLNAENNEYSCEDGHLIFPPVGHFESGGIASAYTKYTRILFPADNYLVVQTKTTDIGEVLFFPIVGSSSYWHRFKRVPE